MEDIEKQTVRRLRLDIQVPGTCTGTKAAVAPSPAPAIGPLEESQTSSSFPYQSRKDTVAPGWTWMLEVTVGNKDEMEDAKRWCLTFGTLDTGQIITRELGESGYTCKREKSWALNWIVSSLVRKLGCARTRALVKDSGLNKVDFTQKRLSASV